MRATYQSWRARGNKTILASIPDIKRTHPAYIRDVRLSFRCVTNPGKHHNYPLQNKHSPENRPGPKRKRSYSKHPFSGVKLLVSGRVIWLTLFRSHKCIPGNPWFHGHKGNHFEAFSCLVKRNGNQEGFNSTGMRFYKCTYILHNYNLYIGKSYQHRSLDV